MRALKSSLRLVFLSNAHLWHCNFIYPVIYLFFFSVRSVLHHHCLWWLHIRTRSQHIQITSISFQGIYNWNYEYMKFIYLNCGMNQACRDPGKPDFFRLSFRNCISCVNNCEDLLYIHFVFTTVFEFGIPCKQRLLSPTGTQGSQETSACRVKLVLLLETILYQESSRS